MSEGIVVTSLDHGETTCKLKQYAYHITNILSLENTIYFLLVVSSRVHIVTNS